MVVKAKYILSPLHMYTAHIAISGILNFKYTLVISMHYVVVCRLCHAWQRPYNINLIALEAVAKNPNTILVQRLRFFDSATLRMTFRGIVLKNDM